MRRRVVSLNPRNVLPQIHTDIPPQCLKTPLLHLHHRYHCHTPQTLVMEKRPRNRIRSFIAPFEYWHNRPCRSRENDSHCCTHFPLAFCDVRQLRNIFPRRGERISRITIKLIKLPRKRPEELLFLLHMLSIGRINDITPTSIVPAMQITSKT